MAEKYVLDSDKNSSISLEKDRSFSILLFLISILISFTLGFSVFFFSNNYKLLQLSNIRTEEASQIQEEFTAYQDLRIEYLELKTKYDEEKYNFQYFNKLNEIMTKMRQKQEEMKKYETASYFYENIYPSFYEVKITFTDSTVIGSSFVFKKENNKIYFLTNYHVISSILTKEEPYMLNLYNDDYKLSSTNLRVYAYDKNYDMAIITYDNSNTQYEFKRLNIANSSHKKDTVIAIGSPQNNFGVVSVGSICAIDTIVESDIINTNYDLIYHNATISKGCSGGPLINLQGEVVGINTFGTQIGSTYYGLASPYNQITAFLKNKQLF